VLAAVDQSVRGRKRLQASALFWRGSMKREREREHERTEEKGATAVEYGLLVALIAAVIISTVAILGQKLIPGFQTVINYLTL
jgi:pilus assembly protein Flp/PilA